MISLKNTTEGAPKHLKVIGKTKKGTIIDAPAGATLTVNKTAGDDTVQPDDNSAPGASIIPATTPGTSTFTATATAGELSATEEVSDEVTQEPADSIAVVEG